MNQLCNTVQPLFNRRQILQNASCGFGWLAFSSLATLANGRQHDEPSKAHFPTKAKRVIFLCMRGGPSHVDTFDYKPQLIKDDGRPGPRPGSKYMKSPWKFQQHGKSGLWMSELFPNLSKQTDKLCMIHSMQTDLPAHPQAMIRLHTGTSQFVRPSLGAWTLYGLGSENENLPGFVSISPQGGGGGSQNYGSAFLPAIYQGTRIGNEGRNFDQATLPNLDPIIDSRLQKTELDFIQTLNRKKLAQDKSNAEVEGVIQSYELAFRMQSEMPKILDLSQETNATKTLYGTEQRTTGAFAKKCLLREGSSNPVYDSWRSLMAIGIITSSWIRIYLATVKPSINRSPHCFRTWRSEVYCRKPWSCGPVSLDVHPMRKAATVETTTTRRSLFGWQVVESKQGLRMAVAAIMAMKPAKIRYRSSTSTPPCWRYSASIMKSSPIDTRVATSDSPMSKAASSRT